MIAASAYGLCTRQSLAIDPTCAWRRVVVGGEQRRRRGAAAVAASSGGGGGEQRRWRRAAGGSAALPPPPDSPSRISMTCGTTPAETLRDPVMPTPL
jgi:hypothetical protein